MDKMTKEDGSSLNMVSENLEALKAIFPEAFTEDGVDFEVLRQLLGDVVAESEEKYGLTWHGKKKARQIALMPSLGTLRPCKEESVDWDTTQNLFIEGDNLEVLKLLQKSYANKVKMIYIDPPYNTGGEFIYPDKFQDNLDTYLRYTGQKDSEGLIISSNTESSGRYHTRWLNMMYPRLKLARNFLRPDGAIFVSIDDNEVHNLRRMMDEIFGEENFVNCISVKMSEASGVKMAHIKSRMPKLKEYILLYRKSEVLQLNPATVRNEEWNEEYKEFLDNIDKDKIEKIKSIIDQDEPTLEDVSKVNTFLSDARIISCKEAHRIYGGSEEFSDWRWRNAWRIIQAVGSSSVKKLVEMNCNDCKQDILSVLSPKKKLYLYKTKFNQKTKAPRIQILFADKNIEQKVGDFWQDIKTTGGIGAEGGVIFPNGKKPLKLLRRLIDLTTATHANDIIMDFFAGSGSTGQAILDANAELSGNRHFILVQIPEKIDESNELYKLGFNTVPEVALKRLHNVIESHHLGGFKVFKLDSSNIRAWNPDRNDLEQTLIDHMEHLVEDRSEEDVLYELLLKRGVDLTVPIEKKTITGKTVYSIGYGVLFACLDTSISREEVEDLAMGIIGWHKELEPASDTQVVFRDSAFDGDIAKTNMTAILEQHGIKHVRSL